MSLCINGSEHKARRINKGLFNEWLIKFYGIRYYSSMHGRKMRAGTMAYIPKALRYESKNACIIKRREFLLLLALKKRQQEGRYAVKYMLFVCDEIRIKKIS
jgi:hypothetical protein